MGLPYERKIFSHHILHRRQFHAADVFEAGGEFVAGGEVVVEIFEADELLELREQRDDLIDLLVVQKDPEDPLASLPDLLRLPQGRGRAGIVLRLRLTDGARDGSSNE